MVCLLLCYANMHMSKVLLVILRLFATVKIKYKALYQVLEVLKLETFEQLEKVAKFFIKKHKPPKKMFQTYP